jgi:diacylglycerol O-acyltransferase / trehalose O-mycolyltransferase
MRDLSVASPALDRTVQVRLLLPVHYSARPERRWPVLYLLHGCCDTYQSWTRSTDVEQLSARSDVLVVMPDGGKAGFYSDWLTGPRWETFHLIELRRILERNYRASTVMAIAGASMGGLGALAYAARHPGLFRAAASFSGIVDTRLTPQESQRYVDLIRSQGEDPKHLWGNPHDRAAVWAAHNPYDLAPKLRGTSLFVAVGSGQPGPLDHAGTAPSTIETSLAAENAALAERLRTLQIPAHLDFYGPGTHNWPYWQQDLHHAWPLLEHALDTERRFSPPPGTRTIALNNVHVSEVSATPGRQGCLNAPSSSFRQDSARPLRFPSGRQSWHQLVNGTVRQASRGPAAPPGAVSSRCTTTECAPSGCASSTRKCQWTTAVASPCPVSSVVKSSQTSLVAFAVPGTF